MSNPSQLGPLFAIYASSIEEQEHKKRKIVEDEDRKRMLLILLHEHGDIFVWIDKTRGQVAKMNQSLYR